MTTKKNYQELENEKRRGKRRYLERISEEQDADREIKDYAPEEEQLIEDRPATSNPR